MNKEETTKAKKSLKNSMKDGIAASIMVGSGDTYLNPFAIALKATNTQISLLSSLPNLLSSIFQIKAPLLIEKFKKRKKLVSLFVFLHSLMWIPIILTPFLFPKTLAVWFLVFFVTVYSVLNGIASPAWASLMSDLVNEKIRGKYFGYRNKILGIVTLTATLMAGYTLEVFSKHTNILYGFGFIFSLALISRVISWYYLRKMHEPIYHRTKDIYRFKEFLKKINYPFGKFVIFYSLITLGANIAGPFFSVYMLRDLGFSYLTYTILTVFASLGSILGMQMWGRYIDEYGNIKILKLTGIFIIFLPWFWLLSNLPFYLVFIQLLGGFMWAGFGLAGFNYIFSSTLDKRAYYVAYFNVFIGIGAFLGATLGGLISTFLFSNLLILFFISGLFRLLIYFLMFNRLKEIQVYKHIKNMDLFLEVTGIGPMVGVINKAIGWKKEKNIEK
ncbi:MAG: MFS transporter [Nanoarchaeota archaeon]